MTQCLILHVYRNLNLKQCLILLYCLTVCQYFSYSTEKNFLNHSIWQTQTLRFAEMQKFDAMIFVGVISFYFILVCVIWWVSCHSSCVAFHCNGSVGYVVLSLFLFTRLHRQLSNLNQKCKVMIQIYRPYKPCKTQDCQQQNST